MNSDPLQADASPPPPDRPGLAARRPLPRPLAAMFVAGLVFAAVWLLVGQKLWDDYQALRRESTASEDSVPAGYVGLNYRRSYNDRPIDFKAEKDGRKLLFAAKGPDGQVEYYDVTDADLDPVVLEGGYGRDSIPGVDAPIFKEAESEPVRALRARQVVYGFRPDDGPRAYPKNLIEKIEVVNDRDRSAPFVVVYDRGREKALAFERTLGDSVVTFGTTGYSLGKSPVLYDRKTRSLWLVRGDDLTCVGGPLKGTKARPYRQPEVSTWAEWKGRHPDTIVLFGNDRDKPIPSE